MPLITAIDVTMATMASVIRISIMFGFRLDLYPEKDSLFCGFYKGYPGEKLDKRGECFTGYPPYRNFGKNFRLLK